MTEPSSPPPRGIYYGWMMIVVAALAMAATLPGRTHGLSLITLPMLESLSVSQWDFAVMNCCASLIGALFCIPCGWLIDRWSLRVVLCLVIEALGFTVVWMSRIEDPVALAVAVTLTRGLGQSMLSVLSISIVARWFQRRLGPAMGMYSVLLTFFMAIAFGVIGTLVQSRGWREPWLYLGYGLLILAPIVAILSANRPKHAEVEFANSSAPVKESESGPTWLAALATPCFWTFSVSFAYFALITSGLTLFQEFVLKERGFSQQVFIGVQTVAMFTGMIANLGFGWLAQRRSLPRLLSVALALLALSLGAFPFVRELWQVWIYAVAYGAAGGMLTVLFFVVWGRAFGGSHLGRIQGAAQMMTVFASAIGPLMIEWSRLSSGSYVQAFAVSTVVCALFSLAAWFTPLPSYAAVTNPQLQST